MLTEGGFFKEITNKGVRFCRDWTSGSYVQNVLLGISEQCPGSTNLLGTESDAAYVIDEDVAGTRGWPQQSRAGDALLADDPNETFGGSGPTQSGLDPGSLYSASSLSVLVLVVLVATLFGFLVWEEGDSHMI